MLGHAWQFRDGHAKYHELFSEIDQNNLKSMELTDSPGDWNWSTTNFMYTWWSCTVSWCCNMLQHVAEDKHPFLHLSLRHCSPSGCTWLCIGVGWQASIICLKHRFVVGPIHKRRGYVGLRRIETDWDGLRRIVDIRGRLVSLVPWKTWPVVQLRRYCPRCGPCKLCSSRQAAACHLHLSPRRQNLTLEICDDFVIFRRFSEAGSPNSGPSGNSGVCALPCKRVHGNPWNSLIQTAFCDGTWVRSAHRANFEFASDLGASSISCCIFSFKFCTHP